MRILSLFCLFVLLASTSNEPPKWLLAIHASSGEVSDGLLRLKGVNTAVVALKSGQTSETKVLPIHKLIPRWSTLFPKSISRATLSFKTQKGEIEEHLVVLQAPQWIDDVLMFQIIEIAEQIEGSFGESILYIDRAHLVYIDKEEIPNV